MARESPEEILREKVVSENAHGLFLIAPDVMCDFG